MARWLFRLLLVVAVLFGAPYASLILYHLMGSWSAVGVEADGTTTTMEFGPGVPRPDWVPVLPDSSIVGSSRIVSSSHVSGFGILELATRAPLDEAKQFYVGRLEAAGFTVTDEGTGTLNAAAADYLGVAAMLVGNRPATGDQINVLIRTSEGMMFPSRLIQLNWRKVSGP